MGKKHEHTCQQQKHQDIFLAPVLDIYTGFFRKLTKAWTYYLNNKKKHYFSPEICSAKERSLTEGQSSIKTSIQFKT